jgi:N-acetylneuraminic acid mutarotase
MRRSNWAAWAFLALFLVTVLGEIAVSAEGPAVAVEWSSIAPMVKPRHAGVAVVADGKIYAIGGIETGGSITVYGMTYPATTGARVEAYDPKTNTWTEKAPLPYPIDLATRKAEGRQWLAAAAYKGKIYTFGGANLYGEVRDTVDVYDIEKDAWTARIARLPEPALGMSAATVGDKIYLFGGGSSVDPLAPQAYSDRTYEFDPATLRFTARAPLPIPRFKTQATPYKGKILVFAGISAMGAANAQLYDPATDSWSAIPSVSWERRFWFGDVIGDLVLLAGGRDEHGKSSSVVDVYSDSWGAWVGATGLVAPREDAFVAALGGALYVMGGRDEAGTALAAAEKGIPPQGPIAVEIPPAPPAAVTITWSAKAPMPTPRAFGATAVVNNAIYTLGGLEKGKGASRAVEAYDPVTDRWTTKAPLPEARYNLAAAAVQGKIYLFGGADSSLQVVDTIDVYDTSTDTWQAKVARLPAPAAGVAAATYGGKIYLFGGSKSPQMFVPSGNYYATVYEFDPVSLTFKPLAPMPVARNMAYACPVGGGVQVIGGMQSPGATFNGHYSFNSGGWQVDVALPQPMGGHGGVVVSGNIYILGGTAVPVVFRWNPEAGAWETCSPFPDAQSLAFAAAASAEREAREEAKRIYILGGLGATGEVTGDVEEGVIAGE